jgi:uncharacterized protein YndB with AHSA1/START domain
MAHTNEVKTGIKPEPLVISRTFPVPREQVFKAWSSAEHLKRWFSPEGYTVPEAEIDFRPGGVCAICMRSSEGQDFWSRGKYLEIAPPQRLVFTSAIAVGGSQKFTAHTTVTFEAEGAGTRMTVRQIYEVFRRGFSGRRRGCRRRLAHHARQAGAGSRAHRRRRRRPSRACQLLAGAHL